MSALTTQGYGNYLRTYLLWRLSILWKRQRLPADEVYTLLSNVALFEKSLSCAVEEKTIGRRRIVGTCEKIGRILDRSEVPEDPEERAKAEDDSICRSRRECFWGPVARFTAWHASHARKLARDRTTPVLCRYIPEERTGERWRTTVIRDEPSKEEREREGGKRIKSEERKGSPFGDGRGDERKRERSFEKGLTTGS